MNSVRRGEAAGELPTGAAGTVVTVGTFDGIHRGHRNVIEHVARVARERGLASLLVTFEPHPLEVLRPAEAPRLLTVGDEKLEAVAGTSVQYMAVVPFTRALARYSAARFLTSVLCQRFDARHLVIGYDHGLGRGREGGVDVLRSLGAERGMTVDVVPAVAGPGGEPISSSLIRRAVADGDLAGAEAALGRPYAVAGHVGSGDRRGRLLGFRTINLGAPPAAKLLPPEGVYAVRVDTPLGRAGGMLNLGPRPTFGDQATSQEVHLFDVEEDVDLYGARVRVEFAEWLRATRRFGTPAELTTQLHSDADAARRALTRPGAPGKL